MIIRPERWECWKNVLIDMERRKFLRTTGLAGAMVTCLPASGVGALFAPRMSTLKLPESRLHVRHGVFSEPAFWKQSVLPGIASLQRDVMFADGMRPSSRDLYTLRLRGEDGQMSYCFVDGQVHLMRDQQESPQKLDQGKPHQLLAGLTGQVECFNRPSKRSFSFPTQVVVIPVMPPIQVDGERLPVDVAAVIPAGRSFVLKGEEGSGFLLLTSAD